MSEHEEPAAQPSLHSTESSRYGSVISTRPLPLKVKRRKPWNRWWHKAIHYWRYGYSHPDEDLLGVIEAVGDALHVEVIAVRAILTGGPALEAERIKEELDEELGKGLPDFSTLLGIESRIHALYPPDMARRRQWVLRDRFERVAPPGAMQYWQAERLQAQVAEGQAAADMTASGASDASAAATEDPDGADPSGGDGTGGGGTGGGGTGGGGGGGGTPPPGPGAANDSGADAQTLLGYIHTNYLMTIGREKAVRDLKRWLLMRFFLFLLVLLPVLLAVWIALWFNDMGEYWGLLLGLFLIAAAGRAGATTSVIRRLQAAISSNVLAADPIVELAALRTGKNEISMALLSSSIFALLMWALFASGVPHLVGLEGGIFPRAITAQADAGASPETTEETDDQAEDDGNANTSTSVDAPDQNAVAPAKPGASAPAGEPSDEGEQPENPSPPPAAAPATPAGPSAAGTTGAGGARTAPIAARPSRLVAFESRVTLAEDEYRAKMAELRGATGILNWVQRRRIRHAARNAIASAISNQDAVIAFAERQGRDASDEVKRHWAAELVDARTKREELVALEGEVTGHVSPKPGVTCPAGKTCNPFPALATALRLADESDFFKMLLWAFIAGFAERFVPDMLDRVVARSRGPTAADSDAALAAQVRAGTLPSSMPPQHPPARPREDRDSDP